MMEKSVLLLGATGLVGSECLKLLSERDAFGRIVVLVRNEIPGMPKDARIAYHRIDFDRPETYRELLRVDRVICALGTTIKQAKTQEKFRQVDFGYPSAMAREALAQGAEHFLVVSALGANPTAKTFYSRVKGELEAALQQLGYKSLSIFRPSLLLGKRAEFRLGEQLGTFAAKALSFAIPVKYRAIEARDVALAMIKTAVANQPGVRILESNDIKAAARS